MASGVSGVLQFVQVIGSLATPLIVLAFGFLISRKLDEARALQSKEREWQTKWAEEFLSRATAFNNYVEKFVFSLFLMGQISRSPTDPRASKVNEMNLDIWDLRDDVQRSEWSLKNHLHFATQSGGAVLSAASDVTNLVRRLAEEKQGELEPIGKALFKFNAAVKVAHRELLSL